MNENMLNRLLAMFENQSKGLIRIAGLFVLVVIFLQLVFLRDYIQMNHVLESSQFELEEMKTDKNGVGEFLAATDAFRKQLTDSTHRVKTALQQFPKHLRQGIIHAPARSVSGRSDPEDTPQGRALPIQSMVPVLPLPDLPNSRSVEDIQAWIDRQFVIINKDIDREIKQPLLRQLDGLKSRLNEDDFNKLKERLISMDIRQPENRNWWRVYSGKIAMSGASMNDISAISKKIHSSVGDIHNSTNNLLSELESKLGQLQSEQKKRQEQLKALEEELQSTLAGLKSNISKLGLPFGDMIPVNLSTFLKAYPVLLIAIVLWLFARMMKLLVLRQELFKGNHGNNADVDLLDVEYFDKIYTPWLIKPFVNSEEQKKTLTSSMQSLSVGLVVFLVPVAALVDTVYRLNAYPSEEMAGVSSIYIAGILLLIAGIPVFYNRLRE